MNRISRGLLSIAGFAALGLGALALMTSAPAGAQDYNNQGLQPPPYKYYSQYARKNGMYLNIGNIAYVRVPTIRLRTGAVKFREVQAANNGGVNFVTGAGRYRAGSASYGKQQRILIPVKTPYYYKPYGNGGPFYGQPSGYVADYYGMNGYGLPNGTPQGGGQLGYGGYGFNMAQALQGLPNAQQQPSYQGSFNAPRPMVMVPPQQQRPVAQPRIVQFNGATVKSGNLPEVLKPAGKNFIRVE